VVGEGEGEALSESEVEAYLEEVFEEALEDWATCDILVLQHVSKTGSTYQSQFRGQLPEGSYTVTRDNKFYDLESAKAGLRDAKQFLARTNAPLGSIKTAQLVANRETQYAMYVKAGWSSELHARSCIALTNRDAYTWAESAFSWGLRDAKPSAATDHKFRFFRNLANMQVSYFQEVQHAVSLLVVDGARQQAFGEFLSRHLERQGHPVTREQEVQIVHFQEHAHMERVDLATWVQDVNELDLAMYNVTANAPLHYCRFHSLHERDEVTRFSRRREMWCQQMMEVAERFEWKPPPYDWNEYLLSHIVNDVAVPGKKSKKG
jgi:hypothetical protein